MLQELHVILQLLRLSRLFLLKKFDLLIRRLQCLLQSRNLLFLQSNQLIHPSLVLLKLFHLIVVLFRMLVLAPLHFFQLVLYRFNVQFQLLLDPYMVPHITFQLLDHLFILIHILFIVRLGC